MKTMVTALYDEESGELEKVTWSRVFTAETCLMQLDVLGDLLNAVKAHYNERLEEWNDELKVASAAAKPATDSQPTSLVTTQPSPKAPKGGSGSANTSSTAGS